MDVSSTPSDSVPNDRKSSPSPPSSPSLPPRASSPCPLPSSCANSPAKSSTENSTNVPSKQEKMIIIDSSIENPPVQPIQHIQPVPPKVDTFGGGAQDEAGDWMTMMTTDTQTFIYPNEYSNL